LHIQIFQVLTLRNDYCFRNEESFNLTLYESRCNTTAIQPIEGTAYEHYTNVQLHSVTTSWKAWIFCIVINERCSNPAV